MVGGMLFRGWGLCNLIRHEFYNGFSCEGSYWTTFSLSRDRKSHLYSTSSTRTNRIVHNTTNRYRRLCYSSCYCCCCRTSSNHNNNNDIILISTILLGKSISSTPLNATKTSRRIYSTPRIHVCPLRLLPSTNPRPYPCHDSTTTPYHGRTIRVVCVVVVGGGGGRTASGGGGGGRERGCVCFG
jgi:hypothetical protein